MHELPEFAGLEFADFEHKQHRNFSVGILIGIDFYLVLMTGKVVRSKLSLLHVKQELFRNIFITCRS